LNNEVIYDTAAVKKADLASIIKKLGIVMLQLGSNSFIKQYLSKRFEKLIINFLLCLQAKSHLLF